nr:MULTISPECIES: MFS transporter [Bacillus]
MKVLRMHPFVVNIIIGTFFARLTSSMVMPFLAIYLTKEKGISPVLTGAIIGISSLIGVFTSFLGGYLSDRFGRKIILLMSLFMHSIVFIGFALSDSVIMFFVCSALNGACRSFFEPSSRALMSDFTEEKNKLLIFNFRYTAINVGVAVGPLLGLLLGSSSTTTPFYITSIMYFLYFLSLVLLFKRYPIQSEGKSSLPTTLTQALSVLKKDRIFSLSIIGIICGVIGYSQFGSTLPQYLSSSPIFSG